MQTVVPHLEKETELDLVVIRDFVTEYCSKSERLWSVQSRIDVLSN